MHALASDWLRGHPAFFWRGATLLQLIAEWPQGSKACLQGLSGLYAPDPANGIPDALTAFCNKALYGFGTIGKKTIGTTVNSYFLFAPKDDDVGPGGVKVGKYLAVEKFPAPKN